jgi:hypothetical protein
VGDVVFAAHSEENPDGGPMGAVVAIDGRGSGDITKTGKIWRAGGLGVGFAAPTVAHGRVYVVDNAANLHALDRKTGEVLWSHNLGTIGRAAPVVAGGLLYLTEQNGTVLIVEPGARGAKTLHRETVLMPEGRPAEIWGSVAVAGGRIYFTTEEGLYCLGRKDAGSNAGDSAPSPPPDPAAPAGARPARLLVVPAEFVGRAGEPVAFEAWSFDEMGRLLRKEDAAWSVEGISGEISAKGRLTTAATATTAGRVKAAVGSLAATAQARLFGPLPWKFDFELGPVPRHWIGAGPRFRISERDGGRRLHKPPQEVGLQRASVFIGPPSLAGLTVEADVLFTRQGRRAGDVGVINQGYTLDLMGKKQQLQLRMWAAELEKSTTVRFAAEPDVWYRMKLAVAVRGGRGSVRGKVWRKSEAEPAEWTIALEDPFPVPSGAPGIYGDSATDLYWDDVLIRVSE